MIEVPYRFLTAGVKHEDRGRQQLGRCEGLDALPGGSISELSESVELRALRKAALFINVVHVACPSEPGRCGHAALKAMISAFARLATDFFALLVERCDFPERV